MTACCYSACFKIFLKLPSCIYLKTFRLVVLKNQQKTAGEACAVRRKCFLICFKSFRLFVLCMSTLIQLEKFGPIDYISNNHRRTGLNF